MQSWSGSGPELFVLRWDPTTLRKCSLEGAQTWGSRVSGLAQAKAFKVNTKRRTQGLLPGGSQTQIPREAALEVHTLHAITSFHPFYQDWAHSENVDWGRRTWPVSET